jgi:hypothetical protein
VGAHVILHDTLALDIHRAEIVLRLRMFLRGVHPSQLMRALPGNADHDVVRAGLRAGTFFAGRLSMRGCKIEIAPERIAEGKQLYELTETPVPDIAAMMGISPRTLTRRVVEWGWTPRRAPRHVTDRALVAAAPAVAVVNAAPGAADDSLAPEARTAANAARIQKIVKRGLDAVERVLDKVGPADEGGAERSARTLAAVARTLQEMAAITTPDEGAPPDEADDDPVPRDIDEFRNELARRIHALIDAQSDDESEDGDEADAGTNAQRA